MCIQAGSRGFVSLRTMMPIRSSECNSTVVQLYADQDTRIRAGTLLFHGILPRIRTIGISWLPRWFNRRGCYPPRRRETSKSPFHFLLLYRTVENFSCPLHRYPFSQPDLMLFYFEKALPADSFRGLPRPVQIMKIAKEGVFEMIVEASVHEDEVCVFGAGLVFADEKFTHLQSHDRITGYRSGSNRCAPPRSHALHPSSLHAQSDIARLHSRHI
jgi:hypothetical protein